jgi:GNAT superfamily N-acetyltransferase
VKKLFFNPEFKLDFIRGEKSLRVGSVLPRNKKQISDGLKDMSSTTIRNRFLGSKKEFSDIELEYLTTLDGWNHYALGIEETKDFKRGVALIRLVRSSTFYQEAEVAITIIDQYQRQGLGLLLLRLLILAAHEREITLLSFTFLPSNEAILKLIRSAGTPVPGHSGHDIAQYYLDLKIIDMEHVKAELALTLPEIDNFPIKI